MNGAGKAMRRAAMISLSGLAVAAFAAPEARAQLSAQGGPIAYQADALEYVEGERRLILSGNVELAQADATLRASKLTLLFAPGARTGAGQGGLGANEIERILADGNVFYIRPDQTARGDSAVYETKSDTVTFTGNVIVASRENVIRGETLVLEVGPGRTTIRQGQKPGQRVRGVFSTQGQSAAPQSPPRR